MVPVEVCVEVCVESATGAREAARAGAARVELCCALALGGLTPSAASLAAASGIADVELVALLRPRPGDFLYAEDELQLLRDEVLRARAAGADGLAFGCLTPAGDVDAAACARLLALSGRLPTTFHRAFDQVRDPERALEQLIELGFARVLTSGLSANAFAGRARIAALVRAARGRIQVVAAGGVRPENVLAIVTESGAPAVHFSASVARPSAMRHRNPSARLATAGPPSDESLGIATDCERIRAVVARLRPA
jgi:copper homeostasis protein